MNLFAKAQWRPLGLLKKTGQTTSYGSGSGVDDGGLQKGLSPSYTVLTSGQYSGTTNITLNGKTEAKNNAVVFDNRTRLMWARSQSASLGPSSNGMLPWTTNGSGEGIFTYAAAANAANYAGHNDWRNPSLIELLDLADMEAPTGAPDATAFPSISTVTTVWSATTEPDVTANGMFQNYLNGGAGGGAKTGARLAMLVRGPL